MEVSLHNHSSSHEPRSLISVPLLNKEEKSTVKSYIYNPFQNSRDFKTLITTSSIVTSRNTLKTTAIGLNFPTRHAHRFTLDSKPESSVDE
jgi:hypothetical protein